MEKIRRIAKIDELDTVKSLGKIDGVAYFAVFDSEDILGDNMWCYALNKDNYVEKIFMGALHIGDEEACEDFEKNDPLGRKRKFLADNFDIFR